MEASLSFESYLTFFLGGNLRKSMNLSTQFLWNIKKLPWSMIFPRHYNLLASLWIKLSCRKMHSLIWCLIWSWRLFYLKFCCIFASYRIAIMLHSGLWERNLLRQLEQRIIWSWIVWFKLCFEQWVSGALGFSMIIGLNLKIKFGYAKFF